VLTLARHRRVRTAALIIVIATLAAPAFLDRSPRPAWAEPVVRGARLWQAGAVSVVELDRASPAALLVALRRWRVRRIDVLVLARRSATGTAATMTRRVPARLVLVEAGTEVDAGALQVRVERQATRLVAVVRLRPSE
jgi:hypothetical protein